MASIKPSERVKEIGTKMAEALYEQAIADPRLEFMKKIMGIEIVNKEQAVAKIMANDGELFHNALLQYLDEEHERIEKILALNKCQ